MKLVTYDAGQGPRVGLLEDEQVFDVGFDGDMVAFIEAGAPILSRTPVAGPTLLAPIKPRTLRDFLTFEGHLNTALTRLGRPIPTEWYDTPAYYKGFPETVIGPDTEIPWPHYTNRLDHEAELAIVIGRRGKDISREEAMSYVFGYTIWNDVSARDVQTKELPLGLGPAKAKDWDGSNVLGPCIVTADEIDPSDIRIWVKVNGETWGEDNAGSMHHTFADMIAYASMAQTIYPGEVMGSGTISGGSGVELDRPLKEGDLVEIFAEGTASCAIALAGRVPERTLRYLSGGNGKWILADE